MTTTHYRWNPLTDNVLCEQDENGDVNAAYTQQPGQFGELISQERDGEASYYHFDGLGSARALTAQDGDVTDTYTYAAFGEDVAVSGATDNPFRYAATSGYYSDLETSDVSVRARVYNTELGRWLSEDPLRFVDGLNRYQYVGGSVPNRVDPAGTTWQIASCFHSCEGTCYNQFMANRGWTRSLFRFMLCRHECSRVCLERYGEDPGAPTIVAAIVERAGIVDRLERTRNTNVHLAGGVPALAPMTRRIGVSAGARLASGIGGLTIGVDILARPIDERCSGRRRVRLRPSSTPTCCLYDCDTHEFQFTNNTATPCPRRIRRIDPNIPPGEPRITCWLLDEYPGPCVGW